MRVFVVKNYKLQVILSWEAQVILKNSKIILFLYVKKQQNFQYFEIIKVIQIKAAIKMMSERKAAT